MATKSGRRSSIVELVVAQARMALAALIPQGQQLITTVIHSDKLSRDLTFGEVIQLLHEQHVQATGYPGWNHVFSDDTKTSREMGEQPIDPRAVPAARHIARRLGDVYGWSFDQSLAALAAFSAANMGWSLTILNDRLTTKTNRPVYRLYPTRARGIDSML